MFSTKKLRFLASARAAFMILVAASTVSAVRADVCLHKVFGDHMVLQRDQPVRVWGWAEPGEEVTVRFGGQSLSDAADQHGDWSVMLAPMSANATLQELAITGNNGSDCSKVPWAEPKSNVGCRRSRSAITRPVPISANDSRRPLTGTSRAFRPPLKRWSNGLYRPRRRWRKAERFPHHLESPCIRTSTAGEIGFAFNLSTTA